MPVSTSPRAYDDCFELFEQALSAPKGIRKRAPSAGKAKNLVSRLHKARQIHRLEMTALPPDNPDYGISPYDKLVCSFREVDDSWWVYIEPRLLDGEVEELGGEVVELPKAAPPTPRRLSIKDIKRRKLGAAE